MMSLVRTSAAVAATLLTVVAGFALAQRPARAGDDLAREGELPVFGIPGLGEAAEFYFSPDSRSVIGNAKRDGDASHQVYTATLDGKEIRRISDGAQTACSYYFPDGKRLLWTSTRDWPGLPPGNWSDPRDYPKGAELYSSDLEGKDVKRLTNNQLYEAEASVSPDGRWILFGRQTDGKMDLWRMRPDGSDEQQITRTPEWQEGGAFYMPDGETIITRAWRIEDEAIERARPMQLFTVKHDGSQMRQITHDPGMHWAPFPAPDGRHVAYVRLAPPRNFDVYVRDLETGEEKQLTRWDGFDGFPSFSPDGRWMAFASSRENKPGERTLRTYVMDVSSLGLGPKQARK